MRREMEGLREPPGGAAGGGHGDALARERRLEESNEDLRFDDGLWKLLLTGSVGVHEDFCCPVQLGGRRQQDSTCTPLGVPQDLTAGVSQRKRVTTFAGPRPNSIASGRRVQSLIARATSNPRCRVELSALRDHLQRVEGVGAHEAREEAARLQVEHPLSTLTSLENTINRRARDMLLAPMRTAAGVYQDQQDMNRADGAYPGRSRTAVTACRSNSHAEDEPTLLLFLAHGSCLPHAR